TRDGGHYWIIAFGNYELPSTAGGTLVSVSVTFSKSVTLTLRVFQPPLAGSGPSSCKCPKCDCLDEGSIRQTEELQRSFRLPLRLDQCAPCDWPITRWWTEPSTIGRPRQQIKGRDWKVGSKKSAIESGYQLSRTSPAKTARYLLDSIRRASRAICLGPVFS